MIADAVRCGVATLLEGAAKLDEPVGLVRPGWLPRRSGEGVVAGRAVTAWNPPGQNLAWRFAAPLAGPGDVLVLTGSGPGALLGEIAGSLCRSRGIEGVVVRGAIRDLAALRRSGLSVWAHAIDPRPADKDEVGGVGQPVDIGGVVVCPGDLVAGDDDGILVVPAGVAEAVVASALGHLEVEEEILGRLDAGTYDPRTGFEHLHGGLL